MTEVAYLECRLCRTRQRVEFTTDGTGRTVQQPLPCGCEERKRAGICQDCPSPVEGAAGRALRCGPCKKKARSVYSRRWRENHPEQARERDQRSNAQRRTPEGRARRRERERKYRKKPEVRARILAQRRRRAVKNPHRKAEYARRYKAKHPERVKEQQDRANAKRREAAREYMHRYATKYVGEGKTPKCRQCGDDVPWSGVGRPRLDCPACRGEAAA